MSTNEAKTEEMIRTVKEKAEKKKAETLKILSAMEANGEGITFYRLAKKANVSKSFLYNKRNGMYDAIKEAQARQGETQVPRTNESLTVIVKAQKDEIERLKGQISALQKQNADSWKAKYEREHQKYLDQVEKTKEQEKQLEVAYSYYGNVRNN